MKVLSTLPRGHVLAWAIIIALSLFATATSTVEASVAPAAEEQPAADTHGGCHEWRYRTGTTHYFSGNAGFPHVYVNWGIRYNGCDVEKRWANCSAGTTLISVRNDWCGWYQPTNWNKDLLHVGANWTECSTPISGFGACWGNYVRQHFNHHGQMKWRMYWYNQPSATWVWSSPY